MPAKLQVPRSDVLNSLFIALLTTGLGYGVFFLSTPIAQMDRAGREHQNLFLFALGIVGMVQVISSRRPRMKKPKSDVVVWLTLLLPAYAAIQLLPLPLSVLRVLSPAKAELLDALAPLALRPAFAPLSVAPSLTLEHFLLFAAYAVVFFTIRDMARSGGNAPWLAAFPIVLIAAVQAGWGISQFLAGGEEAFAHGTYPVRNHFAGFLEMALPFAVAYAGAAFGGRSRAGGIPAGQALSGGFGLTAAALILAGIFYSLSRMGLAVSAVSLILIGALSLRSRFDAKGKWILLALLVLAVAAGLALLSPAQMILRFSEISGEDRPNVWHDTLHLIAAYPVFGCGLGGYASAFEKFKTSAFDLVQDYAHNDYLQYLAEFGAAGFSIAVTFLALIWTKSIRAARLAADPRSRWLGLACAGSLAAILIHSAADFNLYVPANAMLLSWICGLAAAIPSAEG